MGNLLFLSVIVIIIVFFILASWDQLVPAREINVSSAIAVKTTAGHISKAESEQIIADLRAQGYTFVTLSQLLAPG